MKTDLPAVSASQLSGVNETAPAQAMVPASKNILDIAMLSLSGGTLVSGSKQNGF